jgi:hypothetical protein
MAGLLWSENLLSPVWLWLGVLAHIILLAYDYYVTGGFCPNCLFFAGVTLFLSMAYLTAAVGIDTPFMVVPTLVSAFALTVYALAFLGYLPLPHAANTERVERKEGNLIMASKKSENDEIAKIQQPTVKEPGPEIKTVKEHLVQNDKQKVKNHTGKNIKTAEQPEQQKMPAQNIKPIYLSVKDAQGNPVNLDLSIKPALLFSPGCPECHKVLAYLSQKKELPYFVGVWYEHEADVADMLSKEGLPGAEYYLLSVPIVNGVPALVLDVNGEEVITKGDASVIKQLSEKK